MNSKVSDKDKKDWESFLFNNEKLENKDEKFLTKKLHKSLTLDLHGYSLEDANKKMNDLIHLCFENNISKFCFISSNTVYPVTDYPVKENDVNFKFFSIFFHV